MWLNDFFQRRKESYVGRLKQENDELREEKKKLLHGILRLEQQLHISRLKEKELRERLAVMESKGKADKG